MAPIHVGCQHDVYVSHFVSAITQTELAISTMVLGYCIARSSVSDMPSYQARKSTQGEPRRCRELEDADVVGLLCAAKLCVRHPIEPKLDLPHNRNSIRCSLH